MVKQLKVSHFRERFPGSLKVHGLNKSVTDVDNKDKWR